MNETTLYSYYQFTFAKHYLLNKRIMMKGFLNRMILKLPKTKKKALPSLIVRETYENLGTKLLPRNFFTNVFVKVCNN